MNKKLLDGIIRAQNNTKI